MVNLLICSLLILFFKAEKPLDFHPRLLDPRTLLAKKTAPMAESLFDTFGLLHKVLEIICCDILSYSPINRQARTRCQFLDVGRVGACYKAEN